jgi:TonB family protein
VPPPPKPSSGTPERETPPRPASGEEKSATETPPRLGDPEGAGEDLPRGESGEGADRAAAEGIQGRDKGSLGVPARPAEGESGAGSRIPGLSKRPARKGLNYGVPLDTGAILGFSFEHSDYDWSDYWSNMYWSIWRSWHGQLYQTTSSFERTAYERASEGLRGKAVLRFTIERNGNVSLVELVTPSGIEPLDLASSNALKGVILPPLPSDFHEPRERVTGSFEIDFDDIRQMKPSLSYAKSLGQF